MMLYVFSSSIMFVSSFIIFRANRNNNHPIMFHPPIIEINDDIWNNGEVPWFELHDYNFTNINITNTKDGLKTWMYDIVF